MKLQTLSTTLNEENELHEWLDQFGYLFERHDSITTLLQSASRLAVELLGVEHCVITWLAEDNATIEIHATFRHEGKHGVYIRKQKGNSTKIQADFENQDNGFSKLGRPTKDKLAAPLQIKNEIVGYLCIANRRKQTNLCFSVVDQNLFLAFSRQIAHAIEMQQMRQLMASRYASMAMNHNKEENHSDRDGYFSNFLEAVKNPDKIAKIIARSFYKDLRKAGFETNQILVVASEIIENLNETFRKTKAKTDDAES